MRIGELFSFVDLEKRVRSDHPLRAIRGLVNEALIALEQEFATLYAPIGRLVNPTGEAAASDAVAGILFDPIGTATDGAVGV